MKSQTRHTVPPLSVVLLTTVIIHLALCNAQSPRPVDDSSSDTDKVCVGTSDLLSVPANKEDHYSNLRERYQNCTYVDGNLELTWLSTNPEHDLSFLHSIREVSGYVLISQVQALRIVFPKLQIIRGRTLFKTTALEEEFALFFTNNRVDNIEMPALRDILNGSVGIYGNSQITHICNIETIDWEEIVTGKDAKYVINFSDPKRSCPPCHESCEAGCWGDGPENCQRFSKINCSPQCHERRCFGSNPRECCHPSCAGGCTGPMRKDCFACRHFNDGGMCTQECPATQYGNICVNTCQKAVIDGDVILKCLGEEETCPDGYYHEIVGPHEEGILQPLIGSPACRKCHPRCRECTAYGFHVSVCLECKNYRQGELCEDECPVDHYADEERRECKPCDDECRGCDGPTAAECHKCRNYRLYWGEGSVSEESTRMPGFNCTSTCPPESPHKVLPEDGDPYCATDPSVDRILLHHETPVVNRAIGRQLNCYLLLAIVLSFGGTFVVVVHTRQQRQSSSSASGTLCRTQPSSQRPTEMIGYSIVQNSVPDY